MTLKSYHTRITQTAILLFITCIFATSNAFAATGKLPVVESMPKKVLFTGNSFSFYNNSVHNQLAALIRANGEWKKGQNRMRLLSLSGGHMHEMRPLLSSYLSSSKNWQAVVLQPHSNELVTKSKQKRFHRNFEKTVKMLRDKQIQPILFMTWPYANDNKMAVELRTGFTQLSKQHQVPLVPVGVAFEYAAKALPKIKLYSADVLGKSKQGKVTYRKTLKHPSEAGSYLAACVFYAALYHKSPEGNRYHANLSKSTATKLQRVSWQVVSPMLSKSK